MGRIAIIELPEDPVDGGVCFIVHEFLKVAFTGRLFDCQCKIKRLGTRRSMSLALFDDGKHFPVGFFQFGTKLAIQRITTSIAPWIVD